MSGTSQRFRSLVSSPGKPTISPSRHIILPVKVAIQMKPAKASLDPNGWLKDLLKSAILSGAAPLRRGNSTSPNRLPGSIRQCLKGTCRSFCGFTIPGSGESRSALHKHERPVARASQIAEQTVDQKPQRHPRGNVDAQKVMLWLSKDIVHVLFVSTFAYGKPTVEAAYGHGHYAVVLVASHHAGGADGTRAAVGGRRGVGQAHPSGHGPVLGRGVELGREGAALRREGDVLPAVLVSVGNHEDAVNVVFAEPRLHDNLCRANLMHLVIRRCFTATVTGCGLVQKPCDGAGKHQSDSCGDGPNSLNSLVGSPGLHKVKPGSQDEEAPALEQVFVETGSTRRLFPFPKLFASSHKPCPRYADLALFYTVYLPALNKSHPCLLQARSSLGA